MKSKSLWYVGTKKLEIREIDLPEPGPGEALVSVSVCGVCTWDLFIYSGGFQNQRAFPFYFGHEGIGRVVACGPGVDIAAGTRVALRESKSVGAQGGGHMAEFSLQNANSLIPLPEDDVPDHLFMIEPASCCVNAVNISPPRAGDRVALVGCGYMGGILLQLLAMTPAREIVVFDRRPESLEYARRFEPSRSRSAHSRDDDRRSGVPSVAPVRVIHSHEEPAGKTFAEAEGRFDLVFETTGVEPGFRLADSLVRPGGRLCIFSWQHHPFTFDFGSWHQRGITVHNSSPAESWNMTGCFGQARELIHAKRIDQTPLVTHVGGPDEAVEIYEKGLSKSDGYIKGVIQWRT